jgi:hypothetical protein
MSLGKVLFFVVLVLLLIPSNSEQRYDLYVTAQRTVSDVGNFCTRNPDICEKVKSAIYGALQKLKSGSDSIEDMLRDVGVGGENSQSDTGYSDGYQRQSSVSEKISSDPTSSLSNDTLTFRDRQSPWRGPGSR